MFGSVIEMVGPLQQEVSALEPGCLTGDDAAALLQAFTTIERLAAAGRTKLSRRIEQSNVWRRDGHKTAASYLAQQTGESLGHALATLATAEQLDSLPATAEAFTAGRLSMSQAREIAAAGTANPNAERRLLDDAPRQPLAGLKAACRAAKAATADRDDDQARYRRIHENRYWRKWTDADGAVCGHYRLAPDIGAHMHAEIEAVANQIFQDARRDGRREPPEAYGADALSALVGAGGSGSGREPSGPRATVHVRVDYSVLKRGYIQDGETCEIPGIGPIPASTAQDLARDSVLKILLTDGVDVRAVAHAGRTIPAHLRSALEETRPPMLPARLPRQPRPGDPPPHPLRRRNAGQPGHLRPGMPMGPPPHHLLRLPTKRRPRPLDMGQPQRPPPRRPRPAMTGTRPTTNRRAIRRLGP